MSIELDFLYDDFLSNMDSISPVLNSENDTEIFSEYKFKEEPIHNFPGDFNPDDFLNDLNSGNSLAAENNFSWNTQKLDIPSINLNTAQDWDWIQASPQSSIESSSAASSISPEPINITSIVTIPQGSLLIPLNSSEFGNNSNRIFPKDELLFNSCAITTTTTSGTKTVLPKFISKNNKFDAINTPNKVLLNEKALKKQQRMIRNRESASLSRKKKGEYITTLETKISNLEKENLQLKYEVSSLKTQLTNFIQTCTCTSRQFLTSQKSISSHVKKNTAVLLAMIFMVSLNFGKFHNFLAPEVTLQRNKMVSVELNSKGPSIRKLLWVNDSIITKEEVYGPQENFNISSNRNYINQTENLRLTTELRKLARAQKKNIKSPTLNQDYDPVQYYALKSTKYLNKLLKDQEFNPEGMQYTKLFQKFPRKNDTFYILSFNNENILLPAALYNESSRPKMSLMLPTKSFMGNRKIAFMQIDCEVLNTSTIQLKNNYVQTNIRNQFKTNSLDENKSNLTNNNKNKNKFNSYGLPWKDYNKKNIYKTQLYDDKNGQPSNKNAGVPDLPSMYSLF